MKEIRQESVMQNENNKKGSFEGRFEKEKPEKSGALHSPLTVVEIPQENNPLDPKLKLAYEILIKVLECGKMGDKCLTLVLTTEQILQLLEFLKPIFMGQSSCVEVDSPILVCGDVHGQFSDLLRIFDRTGFPHRSNYLFLGDYVDRGKHNLETIILLFCYKIIFPKHFFLLRGNHECPTINKVYGFYDECLRRYKSAKIWEAFQDVFAAMPLTGVIGDRILCMHGGLSPRMRNIEQLRQIKRPMYQPDSPSLEIDVLWSDPSNFVKGWSLNQRGVSYVFGPDACRKVADDLNIDLVVRAHQVVQDGYEFFASRRLVTIFSAPYYCGQFDNAAAVMLVNEDLLCSFVILRPRKRSMVKKKPIT